MKPRPKFYPGQQVVMARPYKPNEWYTTPDGPLKEGRLYTVKAVAGNTAIQIVGCRTIAKGCDKEGWFSSDYFKPADLDMPTKVEPLPLP